MFGADLNHVYDSIALQKNYGGKILAKDPTIKNTQCDFQNNQRSRGHLLALFSSFPLGFFGVEHPRGFPDTCVPTIKQRLLRIKMRFVEQFADFGQNAFSIGLAKLRAADILWHFLQQKNVASQQREKNS